MVHRQRKKLVLPLLTRMMPRMHWPNLASFQQHCFVAAMRRYCTEAGCKENMHEFLTNRLQSVAQNAMVQLMPATRALRKRNFVDAHFTRMLILGHIQLLREEFALKWWLRRLSRLCTRWKFKCETKLNNKREMLAQKRASPHSGTIDEQTWNKDCKRVSISVELHVLANELVQHEVDVGRLRLGFVLRKTVNARKYA